MADSDWVRGDLLGHAAPVHGEALRAAGASYLTGAFRAAGAMGEDNSVVRITHFEEWAGGSTGRKAMMSVAYERPDPNLPEHLFVKFSRDLDNPLRDRGKGQMESEARFALFSRIPDFPVQVPRCLFAEYQLESGTGVIITERVAFGKGKIEPQHAKARDYEVPDVGAHYDALVTTIAQLAGSHKAGRLPPDLMTQFEDDPFQRQLKARPAYSPQQIRNRVARYADFAARFPQILPEAVRSEAFIARLADEAPRFTEHRDAVLSAIAEIPEMTAFCHWNANIDNAWFWREDDGRLACGLIDWGNVGQIDLVSALTSCLTFAEPDFVVANFDRLFALFAKVYEDCGAEPIDPAAMKMRYILRMTTMSPSWILDAPPLIERQVPDLADVRDRFDPRISEDEHARTQLHLLVNFLTVWGSRDMGALLDQVLEQAGATG